MTLSSSASKLQYTKQFSCETFYSMGVLSLNVGIKIIVRYREENSLEVDEDVFTGLLLFAEEPGLAFDAVMDVVEAHRSSKASSLHAVHLFLFRHPEKHPSSSTRQIK